MAIRKTSGIRETVRFFNWFTSLGGDPGLNDFSEVYSKLKNDNKTRFSSFKKRKETVKRNFNHVFSRRRDYFIENEPNTHSVVFERLERK